MPSRGRYYQAAATAPGRLSGLDHGEQARPAGHGSLNKRSLNALMAQRPAVGRLAVLVDFGIVVSQEVIDYFRWALLTAIFLLPQLRGADPI